MLRARRRALVVALPTLVLLGILGLGVGTTGAAPAPLVGTFRLSAGSCSGTPSGSYFRMILPTGTTSGPFFQNNDSTCADRTFTPLSPGSDGGLATGADQTAPSPAFDGKGNSLAARIIRPVSFVGVRFSVSTNATDLQSHQATRVPALQQDGGHLTGDLSAFDATWNDQSFNQGAPKPDGSKPGNTSAPTGTFDPATGRYTLTWTSQIVGGPFDKFTGLWHLEGTFVAASTGRTTATTSASAGTGGAASPPATVAGSGGATATTLAATTGAPDQAGATTTTVAASGSPVAARTTAATVHDDSFKAPTWLVILLAAAGIAGVVALLVLAPRRSVTP